MLRDVVIKGRSLGGSSDLTLLAPIKQGFIDSLESVTYKTRIKRVIETLHGVRVSSYEYATAQFLSDSVERVGVIHSVRVAVLEPQDNVLLAVTFDGSWESYIRVLWDKVGTLLDLIFCGTVGYVTAWNHSFDEWHAWARRVQVETGFFVGPPAFSARDAGYARRIERMRTRGEGSELLEIRAAQPSAEVAVERFADNQRESTPDDPAYAHVEDPRMIRERIRNGLQGLAALYRLVDLHRPGTEEGEVLRRASIDLLREFVQMRDAALITDQLNDERDERDARDGRVKREGRFERQLAWLFPGEGPARLPRGKAPPPAEISELAARDLPDIQGGIVATYDNLTHGVLLLVAFEGPAAARDFLTWIDAHLTRADQPHDGAGGQTFCNVAFTFSGLRAAGLDEDALEAFPEEFRQGMAARAGLLGDVRNNHPRRWRLPGRYIGSSKEALFPIELDSVHAVVQLRCGVADSDAAALAAVELSDRHHPLRATVIRLRRKNRGLRVLAAQSLVRNYKVVNGKRSIHEHFGYADGDGQPELNVEGQKARPDPFDFNRIHAGELLLGHDNAADVARRKMAPATDPADAARLRWLANGSFLVVRKYRQFVDRLQYAVTATATEMQQQLRGKASVAEYEEIVYAKLMGRDREGEPLVRAKSGTLNNFLYDTDPEGRACPLRAHIRRAHPRLPAGAIARPPRLMRRSMSYGGPKSVDRGLVFMAYNASLGEQFEVVQRWLAGGNSTGVSSAESCPIVGVPENGLPRQFRFEYKKRVFRVELERGVQLFEPPAMLSQLQWGLYLFAPSVSALRALRSVSSAAACMAPEQAPPWRLAHGLEILAGLRRSGEVSDAEAVQRWKAAIEDPESIDRLDSAALWAAIRADHGGLLKTPYGTVVASRDLVARVYRDSAERYSVCGQFERMKKSFGEISLGMDDGPVYRQQSEPINAAIGKLTEAATYETAFAAAKAKIDRIVDQAKWQAGLAKDTRFEVGVDIREALEDVMVALCNAWFGLADDPEGRFSRGGADWTWQEGQPPPYPGHFTALSRYMFQPHPGATAEALGQRYGRALREAMHGFVADHRARGTKPQNGSLPAPIAAAIFDHPELGDDNDFVARNMVGVLMGFNPTIMGAVINVVREWQRDGTFGRLRADLAGRTDHDSARGVLAEAMAAAARMRPMPQIGWRTVRKAHRLGSGPHAVDLEAGDLVVLGVVSATQQSLADGGSDGRLMFGGVRTADKQCPTHACPGYEAAIGAMLGTLAAILARPENMSKGAAPLTFVLEGPSGVPTGTPAEKEPPPRLTEIKGRSGLILAWGDSWLDFRANYVGDVGNDLRDWLAVFDYRIPKDFCSWTSWPKTETLAADPGRFTRFLRRYLQTASELPVAILLSAGGNDSTQSTMKGLLNQKATGVPVLNATALGKHIAALQANYRTVLSALRAEFKASNVADIPALLHGYDYPFPDGKGGIGTQWLKQPFEDMGYTSPADSPGAVRAMRDLIDELNAMLGKLQAEFAFVHYIDLRGTIERHWTADPREGWSNDLHPEPQGFELLAAKIDGALRSLPAARRRSRRRPGT